MSNIYKLKHFYNKGNQDVFFTSDEDIEIIKRKASFIQFRAETIVCDKISLSTRELADILFKNINATELDNQEKATELDMYFVREAFCSIAEELESEMNKEFDLDSLDISIKNTEDGKYYLKSK